MISQRHAHANNPLMGNLYNPAEPTSYIVYLDANNLYGCALSQKLPFGAMEWVPREEFEKIEWEKIEEDGDIGYIVECDLEYPPELHDAHNDYPLAPQRLTIKLGMLSEQQQKLRIQLGLGGNGESTKLCPNLMDKKNYVVHYRNLKFYLQHGMKLRHVHTCLKFEQKAWIAPFIDRNSQLRAMTNSDFEKDLYKLLNN